MSNHELMNHDPKCHAYGYGRGQRMDICICTGIRIGRADERGLKDDEHAVQIATVLDQRDAARERTVAWMDRYNAQVEAERQAWIDLRAKVKAIQAPAYVNKCDTSAFREALYVVDRLLLDEVAK